MPHATSQPQSEKSIHPTTLGVPSPIATTTKPGKEHVETDPALIIMKQEAEKAMKAAAEKQRTEMKAEGSQAVKSGSLAARMQSEADKLAAAVKAKESEEYEIPMGGRKGEHIHADPLSPEMVAKMAMTADKERMNAQDRLLEDLKKVSAAFTREESKRHRAPSAQGGVTVASISREMQAAE
ncbi:hypothetical protein HK102_002840, partial [Quaeritorhiza haematococci]